MENMRIYDRVKECPENAKKKILGGKMKGKTDINPMWRIKTLTEVFGPCGIGWRLVNVKHWTEPGAKGEVSAWCSMELQVKDGDTWSDGIYGVGGSMLVVSEKGNLVTNDEAFKMAYTDAISVCCKMLGVAADVYWDADCTKYDRGAPPQNPQNRNTVYCQECKSPMMPIRKSDGTVVDPVQMVHYTKSTYGMVLCLNCERKRRKAFEGIAQNPNVEQMP